MNVTYAAAIPRSQGFRVLPNNNYNTIFSTANRRRTMLTSNENQSRVSCRRVIFSAFANTRRLNYTIFRKFIAIRTARVPAASRSAVCYGKTLFWFGRARNGIRVLRSIRTCAVCR